MAQETERPGAKFWKLMLQVLLSRPSWERAALLPEQVSSTLQMHSQPPQNLYYPEWQPPSSCFGPTDVPSAFGPSQSWSPGFAGETLLISPLQLTGNPSD